MLILTLETEVTKSFHHKVHLAAVLFLAVLPQQMELAQLSWYFRLYYDLLALFK